MDSPLYHILRYMTSYQRSKLCTVSKDTYSNIIEIGKCFIASLVEPHLQRQLASYYDNTPLDGAHYKFVVKDCHLFIRVCNYGMPWLFRDSNTMLLCTSLLSMTTRYCDIDIIKMLIKNNPRSCSEFVTKSMFKIIQHDRVDIIKEIPKDMVINVNPLMHTAIKYGSSTMLEQLMSKSYFQPHDYKKYMEGLISDTITKNFRDIAENIKIMLMLLNASKDVSCQNDYKNYMNHAGKFLGVVENSYKLSSVLSTINNFAKNDILPAFGKNIC